jgi:hypothetical protein
VSPKLNKLGQKQKENRHAYPKPFKEVGLMAMPDSVMMLSPLSNTQLLAPPGWTVRTNDDPTQGEELDSED